MPLEAFIHVLVFIWEEQTDINCVENKGTVLLKTAFAERTTLTLCRTPTCTPVILRTLGGDETEFLTKFEIGFVATNTSAVEKGYSYLEKKRLHV